MANKIRKMPPRAGQKSQAFLSRQSDGLGRTDVINQENSLQDEEGDHLVIGSMMSKSPESALTNIPDGEVKIFLDDERPCPDGWTLARTPHEFFKLLNQGDDFLNRVTALSFDWYLGANQVTGVDVITHVAHEFFNAHYDKKTYLPNLKRVNFHSSDRDQASRMSNILREILEDKMVDRMKDIRFRRGLPI